MRPSSATSPVTSPSAGLVAVPVLVSVKLLTFLGMGVYRGLWRYVSIDDVIVFAKAVVAASVVTPWPSCSPSASRASRGSSSSWTG